MLTEKHQKPKHLRPCQINTLFVGFIMCILVYYYFLHTSLMELPASKKIYKKNSVIMLSMFALL